MTTGIRPDIINVVHAVYFAIFEAREPENLNYDPDHGYCLGNNPPHWEGVCVRPNGITTIYAGRSRVSESFNPPMTIRQWGRDEFNPCEFASRLSNRLERYHAELARLRAGGNLTQSHKPP